MNIQLNLTMLPLQVIDVSEFWKSKGTYSNDAWLFAVGIGIVIVLLLIVNILRTRFQISGLSGSQGSSNTNSPRRFSNLALHRMTNNMGMDRVQTKMLEFVLKNDAVTDPERSLNSPTLLDRHFKRAFRTIERTAISEDELNDRLAVLFAVRNIIEVSMNTTTTTSTRRIPENSAAVLSVGEINYPIKVISSQGDALIVQSPMSHSGGPVHFERGSRVSLSFYTKTSKGFSVDSRVLGSSETTSGPVLQLVHSGQIKRLSNRRFRRRQTVISTSFYCVYVEETGRRRRETKMTVDKRKFSGNILDISIGGCSIKTSAPLNTGQRLKIEFTREDNSIVVALGEVLRANRSGVCTIMNIKFLRIPRKSLNSINTMVYEYAER